MFLIQTFSVQAPHGKAFNRVIYFGRLSIYFLYFNKFLNVVQKYYWSLRVEKEPHTSENYTWSNLISSYLIVPWIAISMNSLSFSFSVYLSSQDWAFLLSLPHSLRGERRRCFVSRVRIAPSLIKYEIKKEDCHDYQMSRSKSIIEVCVTVGIVR